MEEKTLLLDQIARLEFQNDQLVAEIHYIDQLMRRVGFTRGLATVKATARVLTEGGLNKTLDEL